MGHASAVHLRDVPALALGDWRGRFVVVIAMALYPLPRFKGLIVGVQWAKRIHGF